MAFTDPGLLRTKTHFHALDGLRGVAALCIVVFHFMEMIFTDYSLNFIGHGFLAVDFFFCLSGFVIGYAYDDRIGRIGLGEFFKSRLIRLHPLVLLGSVFGLVFFLYNPFGPDLGHYGVVNVTQLFVSSVLLIPYPLVEERGYALFALNSPSWSLFFEYVFNILYALFIVKLGRSALRAFTMIAAIALLAVAWRSGTLIGGWDGHTIVDGIARISFSFLAGLLVFRSKLILRSGIGFTGLSLILLLTFLMPYFSLNWLAESFVVILVYPLIIALGAGTQVEGATKKICIFLGRLSYPLYMTHIWAIWWFGDYIRLHKPTNMELALIIAAGTLLLAGLGWLTMVLYDTPVRSYLGRKRVERSSPDPGVLLK
ncbi:MAG: acyltransferase [Mucilaginibacter polytrichastri]|nr:acyltransferase [Mucilaginibacter polytrichastri]